MEQKTRTTQDEANDKMDVILNECGLQCTLKALANSLDALTKKRGHSIAGVLILETIKGLHAGYCRRYEEDEWLHEPK